MNSWLHHGSLAAALALALLAAPALADAATTNTTVTATNGVVNRDAQWTYAYANSAVVAAGTGYTVGAPSSATTTTASTAPAKLTAVGRCPVRSQRSGRIITGDVAERVAMIPVFDPSSA